MTSLTAQPRAENLVNLLRDVIATVHGQGRSISFESAYRRCFNLVLARETHRVQTIAKVAMRCLVKQFLSPKEQELRAVMVRDIFMYYNNVSCRQRGSTFLSCDTLFKQARTAWAWRRMLERARARERLNAILPSAVLRFYYRPGGPYDMRTRRLARWCEKRALNDERAEEAEEAEECVHVSKARRVCDPEDE